MSAEAIWKFLDLFGQAFIEALANSFANTITQLIMRAITDSLDAIADAIGDLGTGFRWVEDAVHTFTDNLAAELSGLASNIINGVNWYAQKTAGVLQAQQRLHEQFVDTTEAILTYLYNKAEEEAKSNQRIGAAVTDFLLRFVHGNTDQTLTFVREWYEAIGKQLPEEAKTALGASAEFQKIVTEYIMADLELVDSTAREELQAASGAILQTISQNIEGFREWFTETVVRPVTQYNAMFQAMKHAFQIDPEEFQEQLELFEQTTTEYYQKKAKEMARKVEELSGGGGEVFTPR